MNAELCLLVICCRHDYNSIPSAVASEARAAAAVAQLDALSTAAEEARYRPAAPAAAQQAPQKEPVHPAVAARIDHIQNFAGQQEGSFRVCSGYYYVLLSRRCAVLSMSITHVATGQPICHRQSCPSCPSKVTVRFNQQAEDGRRAFYWPGQVRSGWRKDPVAVCCLQTWLCLERVARMFFHSCFLEGPSASLQALTHAKSIWFVRPERLVMAKS